MSINTNYYLNPTDYIFNGMAYQASDIVYQMPDYGDTAGTTYTYARNCLAAGAYVVNDMVGAEPDRSVSYCATDATADIANFKLYKGLLSTSVDASEFEGYKNSPSAINPIAGWMNYGTYVYVGNNYLQFRSSGSSVSWGNMPWGYGYQSYYTVTGSDNYVAVGFSGKIMPLLKWSIKNIVLSIVVQAAKLNVADLDSMKKYNDVSVRTYDLARYVREGYQEYPYITSIGYVPQWVYKTTNNNYGHVYGSCRFNNWLVGGTAAQASVTWQSTESIITKNIAFFAGGGKSFNVYPTYSDSNTNAPEQSAYVVKIWGAIAENPNDWYTNNAYNYNLVAVVGYDVPCRFCASSESVYNNGGRAYIIPIKHYSDFANNISGFAEYCRKQVARLGMFFSDYLALQNFNPEMTDSYIYLGTIEPNGVTHGAYTSGNANATAIQYSWDDPVNDVLRDTTYDPNNIPIDPTDPNSYINSMQGIDSRSIASFCKTYFVDEINIQYLSSLLNTLCVRNQNESLDDYQLRLSANYLTSNPIDNIISLKYFPINVKSYATSVTNTTVIKLGNQSLTDGTVTAMGVTDAAMRQLITIGLGSLQLQSVYNDFRDYEPYTTAELYLPYCASVALDVRTILDNVLYISYKIDIRTGSCTAIVTLNDPDGLVIETSHGTISVDVPVSGIQSADYQNSLYQGISTLKSAKNQQIAAGIQIAQSFISAASATASGNIQSATAGALSTYATIIGQSNADISVNQSEYNINTTPKQYRSTGSSSPGDGSLMYQYPALIVSRTKMIDDYNQSAYAHTTGFATIKNSQLSQFHGLTVCTNADLSNIPATSAELNMIQQLLNAGIYL